jgi:hypothetical protein
MSPRKTAVTWWEINEDVAAVPKDYGWEGAMALDVSRERMRRRHESQNASLVIPSLSRNLFLFAFQTADALKRDFATSLEMTKDQ